MLLGRRGGKSKEMAVARAGGSKTKGPGYRHFVRQSKKGFFLCKANGLGKATALLRMAPVTPFIGRFSF